MILKHKNNTWRLRPHTHTSYVPLILLLLVVGLLLGSYTAMAQVHPPPQAESVGLTGVVEGEPPTVAATIDTPKNGQRFTTSPITVSGTCPEDTLIEVYKNDIFAGSTLCSPDGTYSFDIDLLIGENELVAKVYDALNQPGPDSNKVTVFYDAVPPQPDAINSLNFGSGSQLVLNTDAVFRGSFPGQNMVMPLAIIGGTPPFAVNIQWGDAENSLISRDNNVTFNATHAYSKAGTYQINIQATDDVGRVAFLSVAAIINGTPGGATTEGTTTGVNPFLALWPLYVSLVAIVISFWLGEKREKRVLAKRGPLYH